MKNIRIIIAIAAGAWSFSMSASAAIDLQTVYVGDIGNASDSNGRGAVNYGYYIGTYEVTNSQYVSFLNATASSDPHGLYFSSMSSGVNGGIQRSGTTGSFTYAVVSGMGNKPVNYVSFWDGARFANWLTTGNTETGVYNLGGVTDPINSSITRDATAWANGGVAITSEDEWYKAAYYQPVDAGGDVDSYWLYQTARNTLANSHATFGGSGTGGRLTDVGTYSAYASYYGTFDQGGNVSEWNETISSYYGYDINRGRRGGGFDGLGAWMASDYGGSDWADNRTVNTGFRISMLAIPEPPSVYGAIFGCLMLVLAVVSRKKRGTRE